jgi:hypothetical protein
MSAVVSAHLPTPSGRREVGDHSISFLQSFSLTCQAEVTHLYIKLLYHD